MAVSRIDPHMREHMIDVLRREYPEIYDYDHGYYCNEFDHLFERLINQGCPVEEAVHHTAQRIMENNPDLRREEIARNHTEGRSSANPYRGSMTDYGVPRTQYEMSERQARERARVFQQEQIRQMTDHHLDATRLMNPFIAKPKKKKLTILEQLQADVDVWLKDSLKLTHLEGIKL